MSFNRAGAERGVIAEDFTPWTGGSCTCTYCTVIIIIIIIHAHILLLF